MPRSKPSMMTYITTAVPMMAAQIRGRYHSMMPSLSVPQRFAPGILRGGDRAGRETPSLGGDFLRAVRDKPVDVINAEPEHDSVCDHEQCECADDCRARHRRSCIGVTKDAVYDPWLASALGDHPAGDDGDESNPPAVRHDLQIPARLEQCAAPPKVCAEKRGRDHEEADGQHDAKGEEYD